MRTQYLYDDVTGACIAEFDENGDTQVEYTTNPQTGELISENHDGQEVYHRYDGEGNTRQTTDSAGNVLGEATYDAFGEPVAESDAMTTTYRFQGQRGYATDPASGYVARSPYEYSPTVGRSLTIVRASTRSGSADRDTTTYSGALKIAVGSPFQLILAWTQIIPPTRPSVHVPSPYRPRPRRNPYPLILGGGYGNWCGFWRVGPGEPVERYR